MFYSVDTHAVQAEALQQARAYPAAEAAELINRYPNLSEVELARLINLYRELSALDMALMISDESLGPKVDRFYADHRSKLRLPFRQYGALLGLALLGIAAVAWSLAVAQ